MSRFSPVSPISLMRSMRVFSPSPSPDSTNNTKLLMFWNLTKRNGMLAVPSAFQSFSLSSISWVGSSPSASSNPRLCGLFVKSLTTLGRLTSSSSSAADVI